jgi:beta-carotene 3-hydroxylase
VVRGVLVAAGAFAAMEPVSYAAHRWVMHGAGWALHRSHHEHFEDERGWGRLEANDAFPVAFAGVTVLGVAAGTRVAALAPILPVAAGVTAYGAAYALLHDVYIHRRLSVGGLPVRLPPLAVLERLRGAHRRHHRDGGEPYGMLCPIGPKVSLTQPTRSIFRTGENFDDRSL